MATVSIIIRALNEAAHLPALFEGIAAQTRQPEQVVLVDSGSTDESVAISQAAGADIVHIAPGLQLWPGPQRRVRRGDG